MKHPTPSWSIDALMGYEEQSGKQNKKKKNSEWIPKPATLVYGVACYGPHGSNSGPILKPPTQRGIIYIWVGGESGFTCWGGQVAHAQVIVLCECFWNAPTVSLVLPAFEDTGSLSFPPRQVVYPPG